MRLPDDVLDRHLDQSLVRGLVIRLEWDRLDDPNRQTRQKYAVILNNDLPSDQLLVAFTTSRVEFLGQAIFANQVVRVPKGTTGLFSRETIINCREITLVPLPRLRELLHCGKLEILGALPKGVIYQLDEILEHSPVIERRTKRRVVRLDNTV